MFTLNGEKLRELRYENGGKTRKETGGKRGEEGKNKNRHVNEKTSFVFVIVTLVSFITSSLHRKYSASYITSKVIITPVL